MPNIDFGVPLFRKTSIILDEMKSWNVLARVLAECFLFGIQKMTHLFFCFFISYYFISMSPKIWQILKHFINQGLTEFITQLQAKIGKSFHFSFFLKTYILHHQQHRNFRKSWSWYFGAYLTLSSKLLTHCMTNSRVRSSYIAEDIYIYLHHFLKRHEDSNHFLVQ